MRRLLTALLSAALLLGLWVPAAAAETGTYSEDLVTYLKAEEGFQPLPYSDGTGWYIGYGCACGQYDCPEGITEEGADALLRDKLDGFAAAVRDVLDRWGVTVDQGQFDALCAMTYNFGTAWLDRANRLPSYLINGISGYTDQEIASAFAAWCHVGGEPSTGLLRRRLMETKMFLGEEYTGDESGWRWLILDAGDGLLSSDVAAYRQGEPYGALPVPTLAGQSFCGWQREDGSLLNAEDTVTEHLRVTALWAAETPAAPATAAPSDLPAPALAAVFTDVPTDAWYAGAAERLARLGVLGGYEDGSFRPANSVTWGEALKLVLRSAGYPEQSQAGGGHWAVGYRSFAIEKKFLSSGSATDLGVALDREEVADLCAATLELPVDRYAGLDSPFADTAKESVLALYDAGILQGSVENGLRLFKGDTEISRAELCAILDRVLEYCSRSYAQVGGTRVPVDSSLRLNGYDNSAFRTTADGRVYYADPAQTVRYGIDVSYYQGDIDWAKVAADGIDFVMLRCGYRSYGSDAGIREDPKFRTYIAGASAAGLDVGIYFFSSALTAAEAREEADFTLNLIRGYDIRYPVVFDWEQVTSAGSRTRNPDWDAVADCTDAFCAAVAAAGYQPMTYFNKTTAYLKLDMSRIQAYDGWLAWYHDYMDYAYDFQMWQYTSSGRVAGINADVDLDICFRDYAAARG